MKSTDSKRINGMKTIKEKEKNRRYINKANTIVERGLKNPRVLKQILISYIRHGDQLLMGVKKRKTQNIRDHNLIEIFKNKFPEEFKSSLKKYEKENGKD